MSRSIQDSVLELIRIFQKKAKECKDIFSIAGSISLCCQVAFLQSATYPGPYVTKHFWRTISSSTLFSGRESVLAPEKKPESTDSESKVDLHIKPDHSTEHQVKISCKELFDFFKQKMLDALMRATRFSLDVMRKRFMMG